VRSLASELPLQGCGRWQMGYIIAWLLGVPATLLVIFYLIRHLG
jgi:hypothetical protein